MLVPHGHLHEAECGGVPRAGSNHGRDLSGSPTSPAIPGRWPGMAVGSSKWAAVIPPPALPAVRLVGQWQVARGRWRPGCAQGAPRASEWALAYAGDGCASTEHVTMVEVEWKKRAESLMVERGADRLEHPGGTLLEHVARVCDLLAKWGHDEDLRAAGLCHACYGTDGFGFPLLSLDEREELADVIGARAEQWVYRYASCDRKATYPGLGSRRTIGFTDRFTGEILALAEQDASVFVELTAANELDLVLVNPQIGAAWGPGMLELLRGARHRLSDAAWGAWVAAVPSSHRSA